MGCIYGPVAHVYVGFCIGHVEERHNAGVKDPRTGLGVRPGSVIACRATWG